MEYKCPKCGSVIYSRSNVLCGNCGERLPEELLFSPDQRQAVQKQLSEMKKRAREARERESSPGSSDASTDFWI